MCIDPSVRNHDADANSFVLNQIMWLIYPEIPSTRASGGDSPRTAIMCLQVSLSTMSHILSSVKAEI